MSGTGTNSPRPTNDEELSAGNEESTRQVVVAFRSRFSNNGIGEVLRESTDLVGEGEEPTTSNRPGPAGGEVLLW
jgi:hypothetical protein